MPRKTKQEIIDQAEKEGRSAFIADIGLRSCPYPDKGVKKTPHDAWKYGWLMEQKRSHGIEGMK